MPEKLTTKEYAIVAVTFLAIVLLMALVVYAVQTRLPNPPNMLVTIVAAVVVGVVLLFLATMAIDLYRRGGEAARALQRVKQGNTSERLRGVAMLRFIGKSAAYHITSVQQEGVGGPLAGFIVWQARRELDKYALPGLRAAVNDVDANVRYCAFEALQEINTWEALAIAQDALGAKR